MSLAGMDGLRLDQAPPLGIPASFFLLAPVAMVAAGVLAVLPPPGSHWAPAAIALTHLGTLGLIGSVMIGALYQMLPVVAAAPVPGVRLAHGVHVAWILGVAGLTGGLVADHPITVAIGGVALSVALVLLWVPMAIALARAPARTPTVWGMRLALLALLLVAVIGLRGALGHAGGSFAADRAVWLHVHLGLALCGWVGGLLAAVSWQVVPMFYLAPDPDRRGILPLLAIGLAAPLLALVGLSPLPAQIAAAIAVWLLHPIATLRSLAARKRRLADGSLRFWQVGLSVAPLVLVAAAWARFGDDPRAPLLFGWLAIWGWAGTIVHGMLSRIVPFLVWFHRFSPLLGRVPVPPMRQLWPERRLRVGLALHVGTLIVGGFSVTAAGVGMVLTGAWLAGCLVATLRSFPRPPEVAR